MIATLGKIIVVFTIISSFLCGGSAEVSVSKHELYRGESAFLTISLVSNQKSDSLPTIEEIAGVDVLDSRRTSNAKYISVKGQAVMKYIETLTLEFKPLESLIIPSFAFIIDGEQTMTKPIKLNVLDKKTELKNSSFLIEMSTNKSKVYLGESFVVSVVFKQKKELKIMKIEYIKPRFIEFFSKQLGKEKVYSQGDYMVHKLEYLLRAKHLGDLNIRSAKVKVAKRKRTLEEGAWYKDTPSWSNVVSSALTIKVIDENQDYDVLGNIQLKEFIDTQKVKANTPIHLRVELQGEGNLEAYEGLDFNLPNVTVYSDEANISMEYSDKKLKSRYVKSFVFVSDHDFTIPSKILRVFDPKTKELNYLKTKRYFIKIDTVLEKVNHNREPLLYLFLALAFFLGALFLLFLQYIPTLYNKYRAKKFSFDGHEALRILYPYISEDSRVEEMVRKLYALRSGEKDIKIDKKVLKELVEKYKSKGVL